MYMISLFYDTYGMIDFLFYGPFKKYFSHVEQLHLVYNLWDFYNIRDTCHLVCLTYLTLKAPRKKCI